MGDGFIRCRCGHTLFQHSKLIAGWPCREVEQNDSGEWLDCPCGLFDPPSSSEADK